MKATNAAAARHHVVTKTIKVENLCHNLPTVSPNQSRFLVRHSFGALCGTG